MQQTSLHILLVEDNAGDVLLFRKLMQRIESSAKISVATDGEMASDFLNCCGVNGRPDIVVLDLNLPKKSGFEVLAGIRGAAHLQGLPVFILTTTRGEMDRTKSHEMGASGFLTKPALLNDYEALLSRLFNEDFPKARAVCLSPNSASHN